MGVVALLGWWDDGLWMGSLAMDLGSAVDGAYEHLNDEDCNSASTGNVAAKRTSFVVTGGAVPIMHLSLSTAPQYTCDRNRCGMCGVLSSKECSSCVDGDVHLCVDTRRTRDSFTVWHCTTCFGSETYTNAFSNAILVEVIL